MSAYIFIIATAVKFSIYSFINTNIISYNRVNSALNLINSGLFNFISLSAIIAGTRKSISTGEKLFPLSLLVIIGGLGVYLYGGETISSLPCNHSFISYNEQSADSNQLSVNNGGPEVYLYGGETLSGLPCYFAGTRKSISTGEKLFPCPLRYYFYHICSKEFGLDKSSPYKCR